MEETAIQSRVNALAAAMLAKGLRTPSPEAKIGANVQPIVMLRWTVGNYSSYGDSKYQWERADTLAEAFDSADQFVAALPSPEEARLAEFMGALGAVIDLGRETGIEVAFVNPLVETMKRLSENALTFRAGAA